MTIDMDTTYCDTPACAGVIGSPDLIPADAVVHWQPGQAGCYTIQLCDGCYDEHAKLDTPAYCWWCHPDDSADCDECVEGEYGWRNNSLECYMMAY